MHSHYFHMGINIWRQLFGATLDQGKWGSTASQTMQELLPLFCIPWGVSQWSQFVLTLVPCLQTENSWLLSPACISTMIAKNEAKDVEMLFQFPWNKFKLSQIILHLWLMWLTKISILHRWDFKWLYQVNIAVTGSKRCWDWNEVHSQAHKMLLF